MAISRADQPVNNFVRGLITEASPLTFPENASLDEINFKLKRDGSRERRLGLDLEEDFAYYDMGLALTELTTSTQNCFYWPSPNGSSKVDIGVIQLGRYIAFINLLTPNPSANVLNGGNAIDTGLPDTAIWQFAVINNYLLAVNELLEQPYLVSYDDVTDTISYESARLKIRDLYGVDDSLAVNNRPTTLSEVHKYNLRNQGWSTNIVSTCGTDALDCTFSTLGLYPSNSDQWGIGRIGDLTDANVYKYDPTQAQRNVVDGGQVPRGSFIIDLYNRGADRLSQTGIVVPQDSETTYVSTVASYAGRAWYSGIRGRVVGGDDRSPHLGNAVIFSQVFRNKEDLVKCYQEADPTSYSFNEVVDTDGGVLHITEAVEIKRLKAVKQSLFVFAKNGVWEIRGGDDGFTATVFQVNKISSVGVYSPNSIVEANGLIYFWATSGIYRISPNPQFAGQWVTDSITMTTIQELYNNIPDIAKRNAKGYYDFKSNKARWLYTSDYAKVQGTPIDKPAAVALGDVLNVEISGRFVRRVSVCALDSTTYAVVCITAGTYGGSTSGDIRGFIVTTADADSSVITAASPVVINNTVSNYSSIRAVRLSSTKFVAVAVDQTDDKPYGVVCDVAGTVITPGTRVKISDNGYSSGLMVDVSPLTSTTFLAIWSMLTSGYTRAVICTVSGTGITMGTEVTIDSSSSNLKSITSTGIADTFIAASTDDLIKFTASGTTVTAGSVIDLSGYTGTTGNEVCALDGTGDFVVSYTVEIALGTYRLMVTNIATMVEVASLVVTVSSASSQPAQLFSLGNNQFGFIYGLSGFKFRMAKYAFAGTSIVRLDDFEIGTELGVVSGVNHAIDVDNAGLTSIRKPIVMATYNSGGTKQYASTFIYNTAGS